jgi:hypothetical protein
MFCLSFGCSATRRVGNGYGWRNREPTLAGDCCVDLGGDGLKEGRRMVIAGIAPETTSNRLRVNG